MKTNYFLILAWLCLGGPLTTVPMAWAKPTHPTDALAADQATTNTSNALSGTYTIGGASPDYATFETAITALASNGISGKVTFRARPGVYPEQVRITNIAGASITDSVIFESESGDASSVTLRYAAAGAADNYVVELSGSRFVHLRNLTINAASTNVFAQALVLSGQLPGISIVGCTLSAPTATSNSMVVFGRVVLLSDFVFRNNVVTGGQGVDVRATTNSARFAGTVIEGNVITEFGREGLQLSGQQAPIIRNNLLSGRGGASSGLLLTNCDGALRVEGNRVLVNNNSLRLNNCQGTTGALGLVANNFLTSTSPSGNGVTLANSVSQQFFHNNVRSGGTSFSANNGSGHQVRNSVLVTTGAGFPVVSYTNASVVSGSNHNNLYAAAGGNIGRIGSTNYLTLANWQTDTGLDSNSFDIDPLFVDVATGDLRIRANILVGAGQDLLSVVPTDINGISRSNPPTIGATEELATRLLTPFRTALRVYPNPTAERIHVDGWALAPSGALVITLHDALGRQVRQVSAAGSSAELDVATLPAGVYSLRMQDGVSAQTQRVVIRR